jgi:DNA-binding SARP family transcriptional activator/Tfp pilus assembly protein PilF
VWFAILGPLLVHDGETQVDVPKGRQRVLLAALLLQAGKPVAADALAEMVWDQASPPGAEITLRSHVLRLRRALGTRAGARLATCPSGYLLQADDDEVDLLRFRCLCRDGNTAARASAWGRAHVLLGEALNLWRGAPLADIPSDSLRQNETQDLEPLRLQAEELRIDAALHLGGHAEVVPGLHSLIVRHPLREHFHCQLMLALHRCGRQAEALAAYQHARDILIEELGAEPGPELRELHQRILSADSDLAMTEPAPTAPAEPALITPRELPPAVPGFTGRSTELRALNQMLERSSAHGGETIVISAIGGTAGVGKTALAVQWAHRAAGQFPDGQLYVNLRGYDPAQPMAATDALAAFLRSLGMPGQDIPPDGDERAARYRSLLADKRMLVILDNAGSADQVRPLLPGTPACTVLVTSRDALAGLVARDGAARLDLDILPLEDAVALLRTLIGAPADADPEAAAELAGQCCRLPLALRVAAELAASRPTIPLAVLTGELADLRTRLDLLDADGDPRAQVRAVFSWSYRQLDAENARALRLLGLHPGPDVDPYAAAALTSMTVEEARQTLDLLARAHLIQPAAPGRYGMHDLLRAYARGLAGAHDGEDSQREALTRLFDHYLQTVSAAMETLFPAERHLRPEIPAASTPAPPVANAAAAQGWLDAQRANLTAAVAHTTRNGWPSHATRLAAALSRYLDVGDHFAEAVIIHSHARDAARGSGDRAAEATALVGLGIVDAQQGRYEQAAGHFQQAAQLYGDSSDRSGQARALSNLGFIHYRQGQYDRAADRFSQAIDLCRQAGDRIGEVRALSNLGAVDWRRGRYEQAVTHQQHAFSLCRHTGDRSGQAWALIRLGEAELRLGLYEQAASSQQQALDLFREIGDHSNMALALTRLGEAELRLGRYEQAAGSQRQALRLCQDTGDRSAQADALTRLGETELRLGRYEQAASHQQDALSLFRQGGERHGEADALNRIGETLLTTGQTGRARVQHAAALALASEIGDPYEQARAHYGLGEVCLAARDHRRARRHWQQALTLFTGLNVPEAGQARARLNAATGSD